MVNRWPEADRRALPRHLAHAPVGVVRHRGIRYCPACCGEVAQVVGDEEVGSPRERGCENAGIFFIGQGG